MTPARCHADVGNGELPRIELTSVDCGHARMRGWAHSARLVTQRHKVAAPRPYGHRSMAGDEESTAVIEIAHELREFGSKQGRGGVPEDGQLARST